MGQSTVDADSTGSAASDGFRGATGPEGEQKPNESEPKFGAKVEQVSGGAAQVAGDQYNAIIYGNVPSTTPAPWEDDLEEVPVLPEPGVPVQRELVEQRSTDLETTRILLLLHAASREVDARAAMRAVLRALQEKNPSRRTYKIPFDSAPKLREMNRAASWPDRLQGTTIYLEGIEARAALRFFNDIELVEALRRRLKQHDAHLVILTTKSAAKLVRHEDDLHRRVALWRFDADDAPEMTDLSTAFPDRFSRMLAAIVALFPGLPLPEFMHLVDVSYTSTSRSSPKWKRWKNGDQDRALADLGASWQRPPRGPRDSFGCIGGGHLSQ